MKQIKPIELNESQSDALNVLLGQENVFLTGQAGTGKSTVIREYMRIRGDSCPPVVASTGIAASIVGGCTFHKFFGVGTLAGGPEVTFHRMKNDLVLSERILRTNEVVVDEISMLSGKYLATAERLCRFIKKSDLPWGGIRVVFVGDFAQLPPVPEKGETKTDWAFLSEVWSRSNLQNIVLREVLRTNEPEYMDVLNQIRVGNVDESVKKFLADRKIRIGDEFQGSHIFPKKSQVYKFNSMKLAQIQSRSIKFVTEYRGSKDGIAQLKKNCLLDDVIELKVGALVMVLVNGVGGGYVNGSQGHVTKIEPSVIVLKMLDKGMLKLERHQFELQNGDGNPIAVAENFPIKLAWALTIHKAQGAPMDRLSMDLFDLWAPGQAYVAMSRARSKNGIFIRRYSLDSILADPEVLEFHKRLNERLRKPGR